MKKVAIVNRTNLLNYGSVLQVLALSEAVKYLGYDTEVIWEKGTISGHLDLRPKKIISIILKLLRYPQYLSCTFKDLRTVSQIPISDKSVSMFKTFVEKNINRRFFESREFKRIGKSDIYYKYICGSDQIWCSTSLYPDPLMYLRFTTKNKRIAYAPSLGRNYIPEYNRNILKRFISDFSAISVRETDGAMLIKQLAGLDAPVVLDPTLLFSKEFWLPYSTPITENGYILCYFLNEPSTAVQEQILSFANGRKIVALRSPFVHINKTYGNIVFPDAGPGEFIGYVANADFVFTDSYHGMLFAINFEKEFLSVEREYGKFDQSSRQLSILNLLGIRNCYNNTGDVSDRTINYPEVKIVLIGLRKKSFHYLKNALDN